MQVIFEVELAQFPVTEGWGEGVREADLRARLSSAFIRLAQGMVDAIWLDLRALKQGYFEVTSLFLKCKNLFLVDACNVPTLKLMNRAIALNDGT